MGTSTAQDVLGLTDFDGKVTGSTSDSAKDTAKPQFRNASDEPVARVSGEYDDQSEPHPDEAQLAAASESDLPLIDRMRKRLTTLERLHDQVEELSRFIMAEVPGEPSQSEGAIETAIRLIREGGSPRDPARRHERSKDHGLTVEPKPAPDEPAG